MPDIETVPFFGLSTISKVRLSFSTSDPVKVISIDWPLDTSTLLISSTVGASFIGLTVIVAVATFNTFLFDESTASKLNWSVPYQSWFGV